MWMSSSYLIPIERPVVPTGEVTGQATEVDWAQWTQKSLAYRNMITGHLLSSLVAIMTELHCMGQVLH
jgi:hypothetical protein